MPSPRVVSESDVVKTFANLEIELRRLIRRQLRGTPHREEGGRIAEEIVTLVRVRWDNAPSYNFWWTQMQGADLSSVSLNNLYKRLEDLKVDVEKVLRAIARRYEWLTSGLLIIDDTSAQKFGLRMQGVSNVHVANIKGGVMGHNIVTLMLASPRGALFLDHEVKVNPSKPRLARHPGAPIKEVRIAQRTKKWEMALDLLRQARAQGIDAAMVLFDCAYFNAGSEVPKRLTDAHVTFISKAKKNDKVIVYGVEMTTKEFREMCIKWKRVRQTDHQFYQMEATLKDGTPVKLVMTRFFRGGSMKVTLTVLVTNGLDISGSAVVLTYLRRWEIERGYQDWKRAMGGMAYHSTDFHCMRNFIWTGFLAYALARRAKQLLGTKVGLPTVLAVRKRAVRSLIASGRTEEQELKTMIPTEKTRPQNSETMMERAG
jgi:SRSO17 transposase